MLKLQVKKRLKSHETESHKQMAMAPWKDDKEQKSCMKCTDAFFVTKKGSLSIVSPYVRCFRTIRIIATRLQ